MPDDLAAGLGLSVSIAIPAIPTSFYPGVPAISKLLNGAAAAAAATTAATTLKTTTTTASG